jgi:hypothetical protein
MVLVFRMHLTLRGTLIQVFLIWFRLTPRLEFGTERQAMLHHVWIHQKSRPGFSLSNHRCADTHLLPLGMPVTSTSSGVTIWIGFSWIQWDIPGGSHSDKMTRSHFATTVWKYTHHGELILTTHTFYLPRTFIFCRTARQQLGYPFVPGFYFFDSGSALPADLQLVTFSAAIVGLTQKQLNCDHIHTTCPSLQQGSAIWSLRFIIVLYVYHKSECFYYIVQSSRPDTLEHGEQGEPGKWRKYVTKASKAPRWYT